MNNSIKNGGLVSGVSTDADANFTTPAAKPILEVATSELSVSKLPAVDTQAKKIESPTAIEVGGTDGPEPTRYGDWEHKGRCYDF
jgi:hypothetical protein